MVERESTALLPAAGNRNLFQRRATATSGGDSFHPWSTPHCAGLPSPPYLAFLPQEVRARDQPPFACLRSLASVRGLRGGCLLAASRPSALARQGERYDGGGFFTCCASPSRERALCTSRRGMCRLCGNSAVGDVVSRISSPTSLLETPPRIVYLSFCSARAWTKRVIVCVTCY